MNGTWIADGRLLAMGMPWPEDLDALVRADVVGLISLTERMPQGLPRDDLRHLHLPIRDFHPPSPAQLAQAVAFIDAGLETGAVAVHCGAGLGRTGTICAAWLVSQGAPPAGAIRDVRRRRPGSIETRDQEAAIVAFARAREGGSGAGDAGGAS